MPDIAKIQHHAEQITRKCVHCGFCLATCPSYQILGEEMNSPRGRIYLLKDLINQAEVTKNVISALDKCLLCRSCETTCPSGVQYHELLDIGKNQIDQYHRSIYDKFIRFLLRKFLTSQNLFDFSVFLARAFKPVLPRRVAKQLLPKTKPAILKKTATKNKVLLLTNCVQPALAPNINKKTIQILNRLGVQVEQLNNCCGAIEQHLGGQKDALARIKTNIDDWYQKLKHSGFSEIISNVSGCGLMINDYPEILINSPNHLTKAKFVSSKHLDISEYLAQFELSQFKPNKPKQISIHSPCTLQHGQKNPHTVSKILAQLGFEFTPCGEDYLCCGSAGTYSITQPKIAKQLAQRKLKNLTETKPQIIVSSNIGCITHLQSHSDTKVCHWLEVLEL